MDRVDPDELAAFQAGMRRRYSDEQILTELQDSAARLDRSPTIREFLEDPDTTVHPQTVVERFGGWNAAKRRAGLRPRRFLTREEQLDALRGLGVRLGRTPTGADLDGFRGGVPSKSTYWSTFGSLRAALREAGFDVPEAEERLARALEQGVMLARGLRRLPRFADWQEAARADPALLSVWQVYRLFDARRGAWSTFQLLIAKRLREEGERVAPDGALASGD